jgi:type II secretory pathway pseudopilin PulG
MSWMYILLIIAIVIVLVLGAIAARLVYKVYRLNQLRSRQLVELAQANAHAIQEQRTRNNKSIQILAQALSQDELTLTEASIRISHLLDQLDVNEAVKAEFSAFYQLRQRTEHIPILVEWKKLSAKEQRVFDKERLQQEATYYDFVMDAAKRILGRQF